MNILLLNVRLGDDSAFGGIETHSATLASFLTGKGHKVILGCCINGPLELRNQNLQIKARKVRIINSGDIRAIFQIWRIALEEKIDLIIANHGREYWPASVAAYLLGIRIFFVRHQVDRIRKTTRWLIVHRVKRVIAVSKAVREALLKCGIPIEKIDVVYNSVPLSLLKPTTVDRDKVRSELGFSPGDIVVGTVAKLDRGKGVFELLSAISRLSGDRRIKLLFVGDGPDRSSLEHAAEMSPVRDRVVFAGVRYDLERIYTAIDIFTLASTCAEAFGMALIEAMSMGKPVIGTNVGGIPEIIEDEVNGILVPPGDALSISHAISRYMDDENFSKKIAAEGRRTVEQRFSVQAMGEQFESILY